MKFIEKKRLEGLEAIWQAYNKRGISSTGMGIVVDQSTDKNWTEKLVRATGAAAFL
jgi:hypothetical protein